MDHTGQAQIDANVATLLVRFAELVADRERAQCIRACETVFMYNPDDDPSVTYIEAIRARDEEQKTTANIMRNFTQG